jgi:hypothetical protein
VRSVTPIRWKTWVRCAFTVFTRAVTTTSTTDDRGREAEPGDDRGGHGEPEPGDDHGGHGEPEPGDDHGGR